MNEPAFRTVACGEVRRDPPLKGFKPNGGTPYSGFVIVRLSSQLRLAEARNIMEVAEELGLKGLGAVLNDYDLSSSRRVVSSVAPEEIIRLEQRGAKTELPPLHSLTSYWRIDVRDRPERVDDIIGRLNELVEVDLAYREMAVTDPVVNATDDTYCVDQDYLDAAPSGIDARWAWTQPNGEGAAIGVVDLEQGWFPNHEDLVGKSPTLIFGDNRDGVGTYKGNHGTAVLGEMVAEDNAVGVVGIAPGVTSVRMVSHYDAASDTALHVADGIIAAAPQMDPGDVLLLEVQRAYLPTETDAADFDAIRLAVALGIIVVEAAGNGGADLDAYSVGGANVLDRTDAAFLESGAIMVGAAESGLPHDRAAFSNYGSRIDCYGWGRNVVTCGYGDLDPGTGDDTTYTDTFSGTSSASPMVSGAALVLQGMVEATAGTRLSPGQMRSLLSDPATGTLQGPTVAGNIGVMPDLRAIIQTTLGLVPDIYLRDNVGDTGVIPSTGSISASPDVIVRPTAIADPGAAFGEGSGTENSMTLGYEVEAGQDNYIYVRMRNRGTSNATGVRADVYWSEVSTLVTPDMWNLIGTTPPLDVPQGDTLEVTEALVWLKADIPTTGHYCFIGILHHGEDPGPPLPPGPPTFTLDAFRAYIRDNNNVTWRNFNVVDALPDPSGDPAALPFLIAGTPAEPWDFNFEVVRRMPKGARVWLEVPLAIAPRLVRGRLWKVEADRKREVVRILLPDQPRVPFCNVRLGPGARHRARFLVEGAKGMERGGHGIAIRQLDGKEEVGRVSWQFHRREREPRKKGDFPKQGAEVASD